MTVPSSNVWLVNSPPNILPSHSAFYFKSIVSTLHYLASAPKNSTERAKNKAPTQKNFKLKTATVKFTAPVTTNINDM